MRLAAKPPGSGLPKDPGKAERAERIRWCWIQSCRSRGPCPTVVRLGYWVFLPLSSRNGYQNCAARFRRIACLAPPCSSGKRLSAIPVSGYSA